jgi:hypothetical protein
MAKAVAMLSLSMGFLVSGTALADHKTGHASSGQKERSLGEIFMPKVCKSPCGGRIDLESREIICLCLA